ncbi:MAG: hypothetical protein AVDCRST_MAG64-1058, partial [uncultured Phycisphaerae bacterium]
SGGGGKPSPTKGGPVATSDTDVEARVEAGAVPSTVGAPGGARTVVTSSGGARPVAKRQSGSRKTKKNRRGGRR